MNKNIGFAAAGVAFLGLAYVVAHGTLHGYGLGFLVALALPMGYLAIERPMLFPFGVYAALVPFNDILNFGSTGTVNKLLGILAFFAILFALIRRGEIVKPSGAVVAWLAVGIWMGLSGIWAIDYKAWESAYVTFAQLFLLYALLSLTITSRADIEALCTCIVTGGLAAAAVAIWPFIHGGMTYQGRLTLPGGTLGDPVDPNQFAAALLLPFAILLSTTLSTRKLAPLAVNLAGILLIAVTIVLSGSRATMVALLCLTLYMTFRSRYRVAAIGVLAFSAAAVLPFWFTIQERFSTAISSGGSGRSDIWNVGLVAFKDNWLFGSGLGSFPAAFDEALMRGHIIHYVNWHRAPHDLILSTLVELGIVGFALVATALVLEYRSLRLRDAGDFLTDLRVALEATLIAVCLNAIFLDVTNRKYLWLIFTMIALVRSAVLNAVETARERRRITCAVPSSPMLVPVSAPPKSSESLSLSRTAG